MKTLNFLLFALLLASCQELPPTSSSKINNYEQFQTEFLQPSKEFRSAPLSVWNDLMTHSEIERNLTELKHAGFGGIFVHPRPGLITEYLSDDWNQLFKFAVEKGKELDMNVWIYDENSYPSGFAGGHLPAQMPEAYNQGQGLVLQKLNQIPDSAAHKFYICLEEKNGQFTDITDQVAKRVNQTGNFYFYAKSYERISDWYGGFSYVDLLYKGVTEKFIELTMKGYEGVAQADFGKTVPGIFTDEPNIAPPDGIRWTPDLFDVFKAEWGYDLKINLSSLFEEVGDWKTVRHNYSKTLLQLFIDRWAKPYHAYCEKNQLKFTGHYWEHGWPDLGHGGDNMAMYAWHQMPAIDMLFNQFDDKSPQAQFGNIRAVKELASVANQMGYNRTLSETYGGAGWEETFNDFKRLGDWEYVLGVNFLNQHLNHMTIVGARKYDYPPSFSYHSPWWKQYGSLNNYFARLSVALSAGQQLNHMLIIEPTSSLWLYYSSKQHSDQLWAIGKSFQSFVSNAEKLQVEYDLGSENIIKDQGSNKNGLFTVGKRSYSTVVIPPLTENIEESTFLLLKKFVVDGGKILCYAKPSYLNGQPSKELEQFFASNPTQIIGCSNVVDLVDHSNTENFQIAHLSGGNLFHHRRSMDDGNIIFVTNSSTSENSTATIRIKAKDLVKLDAFTGNITILSTETKDGWISYSINLAPSESVLLYSFNNMQKLTLPKAKINNSTYTLEDFADKFIEPESDNVLTIDFVDLQLANTSYTDLHIFDAADKIYKQHGFTNGNPWNTSVQYKSNTVKKDSFTTGGFTANYHFNIDNLSNLTSIKAVVERSSYYQIKINGHIVTANPGQWWLDRHFNVLSIAPFVKVGRNTLSLSLTPMSIYAELEPIYITGDFILKSQKKGWLICQPQTLDIGSWKEQGRPFYAQSVNYVQTYNQIDTNKNYQVNLGQWAGTVAEIQVNQQIAGIIFSPPFQLDVSQYMQPGNNTITVKIVGSNKNLLGPFHNNPKQGFVSPWTFRGVKSYPAGDAYQQLDYGLMEYFKLFSQTKTP